MSSEWESLVLGDLVTKRTDFTAVDAETEYEVVGVQRSGWGLVHRDPVRGDSMKFSKLMRLAEGNLVYRTITAFEAPSAVVRPEDAGTFVTPQAFPVFRLDETRISPAFMSLLTTLPTFHEAMSERCTGTVLRRKTLAVSAFLAIPIQLPPLDEQRRIVDLIGAVDETTRAAEDQCNALWSMTQQLLDNSFKGSPRVTVGDLLTEISGGKSPSAERRPPSAGEFGVLKVSAISELGFLPSESKTIQDPAIFSSAMAVRAGDVLISRANTPERVGLACLVDEDHPNLFLSDKTLRLVPKAGVSPAALVAALATAEARTQIQMSGTGTSGSMKNISQEAIRQISVEWPSDFKVQSGIGALNVSQLDAINKLHATANSLRALRAELLSALLTGAHRIPDTYDELMGA